MESLSTVAPGSLKVFPPPGLEDCMMPAKIPIGDIFASAPRSEPAPDAGAPLILNQFQNKGEWVNAVMAVAPHLDAVGLQQALGILDRAIANVQLAKALGVVIATTGEHGGPPALPGSGAQDVAAAELVRAQVHQEQQVLLQQLHMLQARAAIAPGASLRGTAPTPLTSSPQMLPPPPGFNRPDPLFIEKHPVSSPLPTYATTNRGLGGGDSPAAAPAARKVTMQEAKAIALERPVRGANRQAQTLSTSLQMLADEDPECLFIVRRINKLGFKACRKLKQHYSGFGAVVRVLVAHSTVRQHGDPSSNVRRRPSSLGFVLMSGADAVRKVLAVGAEQEIDGAMIRVQRFERHPMDEDEDGGAIDGVGCQGEEGLEAHRFCNYDPESIAGSPGKAIDFDRQQSNWSTASTRTCASAATYASWATAYEPSTQGYISQD